MAFNTAIQSVATAALQALVWLLERLGPVRASNLGGCIARTIGPLLPVSRVGDANLRLAMPELDAPARARILRAVWDNLGRTTAELPHLATLTRTESGPGWELQGEEHLDAVKGRQLLFLSGHLGNWEMMLPIAGQYGFRVSAFYRAASNPGADRLMTDLRRRAWAPGVSMFAKGTTGARAALRHLAAGGSLGMLVDQKMNDGIAVPFFGHPAMTAPAPAQFALKYRTPIILANLVRIGPARFRMVCESIIPNPTADRAADIYALTAAINDTLERWIRAEPGTWLWLHRRWPKNAGQGKTQP